MCPSLFQQMPAQHYKQRKLKTIKKNKEKRGAVVDEKKCITTQPPLQSIWHKSEHEKTLDREIRH